MRFKSYELERHGQAQRGVRAESSQSSSAMEREPSTQWGLLGPRGGGALGRGPPGLAFCGAALRGRDWGLWAGENVLRSFGVTPEAPLSLSRSHSRTLLF